jgi:hypothetical protein
VVEENEPTECARFVFEKSDLKAEASVPPHQTARTLRTIVVVLAIVGAVAGPGYTIRMAATVIPSLGVLMVIGGQLVVLALAIIAVWGRK